MIRFEIDQVSVELHIRTYFYSRIHELATLSANTLKDIVRTGDPSLNDSSLQPTTLIPSIIVDARIRVKKGGGDDEDGEEDSDEESSQYRKTRIADPYSLGTGIYRYQFKNPTDDMTYPIIIHFYEVDGVYDRNPVAMYTKLDVYAPNLEIFNSFYAHCYDSSRTPKDKLSIYISSKYGDWTHYSTIRKRKMEKVYMDESIKTRITQHIQTFIDTKDEYDEFGIPYKTTILLTGAPGNGKSSIVQAICGLFGYDLCIFTMSREHDNASIMSLYQSLPKKTMLLIEDIDDLFHERSVKNISQGISYGGFLNIMDGVLYRQGLITFITTNHPEEIDSAMLRMGRIDMIINIQNPKSKDIRVMIGDVLEKACSPKEREQIATQFIRELRGKEICMSSLMLFAFKYRKDILNHMSELLENWEFIRKTTGDNTKETMYQ